MLIITIFILITTILHICPYSVRMQENADQKNSEYGHFLRSVKFTDAKVIKLHLQFVLLISVSFKNKVTSE